MTDDASPGLDVPDPPHPGDGGGTWPAASLAGLAELVERARDALQADRADDVIDGAGATLDALAAVTASTWSLLGTTQGRLGRAEEQAAAYGRAVEQLAGIVGRLGPSEVVDVVPALVATGNEGPALELLLDAADRHPADPALACLLADRLDASGDPRAADAHAAAAALDAVGLDDTLHRLRRAVELAPAAADYRGNLAIALLAAGETEEAVTQLEQAEALVPDDPRLLAIHAEATRMLGDLPRAAELSAAALAIVPDHGLALGVAGLVERDTYVTTSDPAALGRAADLLGRSLDSDPTNANLRYARATCLADLQRDREALAELDLVLEVLPAAGDVHRLRGDVLSRLGAPEPAIDAYDHALGLDGDDAAAHAGRAVALRSLYRLDEAMASFDRAVELAPASQLYRFERVECLRLAGRSAEALVGIDALVEEVPDQPLVVGTRGQVLAALGDVEGAESAYEAALSLDPSLAWVWRSVAELHLGQGRLDAALEAADRAAELVPDDVSLQILRASLLLQLDRAPEALDAVDRALGLDPGSVVVHYLRGLALLEIEDPQGALADLELAATARSADVGWADVQAWRGEALRRLDRHVEALEAFALALEDAPHHVVALIGRGQSRYATDDLDGAIAALSAAAAEEAADVDQRALAEAWIGESLRRKGRDEEALRHLDTAVELQPGFGFALATRGQVRHNLGDRAGAIADLEAGVAANAALTWAQVDLGELLRLEGRFEEARVHLEAAIAAGVSSAYARGTLGQVLLGVGETEASIAELRAAAELDRQPWVVDALANALMTAPARRPALLEALELVAGLTTDPTLPDRARIERAVAVETPPELLVTKAEALRLLNRTAEALACVEAYLVEHPDDVSARCTQAAALVDRGDTDRALALADGLLADDPELAFARWVRIRALERKERTAEALADTDLLLAQLPADPWTSTTRASLLSDFQRYDEALVLTDEVLAANPQDAYAQAIAGFCLRRLGRFEEAATQLGEAWTAEPDALWYGSELGDALLGTGRREEAMAAYASVVARFAEGDLEDTSSMRSAAWCHLLLDHLDEATALAQAAASLEPDNLSGRLLLALILLRAGRPEVAVDEYEGAAKAAGTRPDAQRAVALLEDAKADLARVAPPGGEPLEGADEALAVLDEALAGLTEALAGLTGGRTH